MELEVIVLLAIGAWFAVLLFAVSLCRAAKAGDAPPVDSQLRTLELDQAAALLNVFPEILLAWEARFGFPTSSPSDHFYSQSEILALRDTLRREPSIAAAVARARERTRRRRGPTRTRVADHRDGGLAS